MGQLEAITRGALTVYQDDRGLTASGEPDGATWESLLYDLTHFRRAPQPYTWVTVTESLPETLRLHRGTRVVFSTPVNTGVPGAETQQGIFPIYARYVSTSMSGTDVDGEKYDVPDVPWVELLQRRRRLMATRALRTGPAVQRLRRAPDRSRAHRLRDARARRHRLGAVITASAVLRRVAED